MRHSMSCETRQLTQRRLEERWVLALLSAAFLTHLKPDELRRANPLRSKPACRKIRSDLAGAVASQPNCPSGQNTTSGECCKQCPPGEGVVTLCGAKQTECAPCLDSEYQEILFFSPNVSPKL
ncbi:hypothetical protein CCH79_00017468 [Gambusia affinis]|uniref:TNFR-Cys domain-containing protein n=1 Tax=Gambusia affinis TaxID=33528 RepID=A0A315UYY2_GAMAF|nr:hypothetical protein CCH79_00017468 [Gambusia affinis]